MDMILMLIWYILKLKFIKEGQSMFGLVVTLANLKILIFSYSYSIGQLFFVVGSLLVYLFSLLILDSIVSSYLYASFTEYFFLI